MGSIADVIAGIFRPVADVIEHVLPSGDAKVQLQEKILESQITAAQSLMDYQQQLMTSQASIIEAEAKSESWIARNWRPILMLTFAGLIVARWLGYMAPNLPESEVVELWSIIKIGIGGYVVGRSVEKTAPSIASAIKAASSNGNTT